MSVDKIPKVFVSKSTPAIFLYLDYRKFLQDLYAHGQAAGLSHRELGIKGGFDPGLVSKVMTGQRNISVKMIPRFCQAFGLGARESRFFELLVRYNQARLPSQKQQCLGALLAQGKERVSMVTRQQHEYYAHWYHAAIRELLNFYPYAGKHPEQLAATLEPEILPKEAKRTVQLLRDLAMLKRAKNGRFELVDALVSSGTEAQPVEVNSFIQQGIELALSAADRFPAEDRNLSALTFSASEDTAQEIIRRVRTFRRELMELIQQDQSPNRVFQMNIQMFPLSKKGKK